MYRGMVKDSDGRPVSGQNAMAKGVATGNALDIRNQDIPISDIGTVRPNTGGMSGSINPLDLPDHRKPPKWNGTNSKVDIFMIEDVKFNPGLKVTSPINNGHIMVEPAYEMILSEYKNKIWKTRPYWKVQEP
jgi:hypothetical protein